MSAEEPKPLDENFTELFVAGENALMAGEEANAVSTDHNPSTPELHNRLQRNLECVQLLRQALCRRPPTNLPWETLGRFQLLRELGRGGFGIVYLAHDPLLNREVALKVPRAEVAVTPELRERFHREARAAAGLDHPNLVPVYEAGEVGPVCFLVSAYCPGITLAHWLKQKSDPVPFRDGALLLTTLAEAVEHAHKRGIIHRDLKPGNIILQIADCRLKKIKAKRGTPWPRKNLQSAICNLQSRR